MSPLKEKEAHFRRLLDVANLGALTPQERAIYDENLKIYRDWKATMEYAVENAEAKGEVRGSRFDSSYGTLQAEKRSSAPRTRDVFGFAGSDTTGL